MKRGNSRTDTGAEYRSIEVGITEHPKFQALSPAGRLLFMVAKLGLGPLGLGHVYAEPMVARTGMPADAIEAGAVELEALGWIKRAGSLWWIVDGLEHEPNLSLANRKHRTFLNRKLAAFPSSLPIVHAFRERYPELGTDEPPTPSKRVPTPPTPSGFFSTGKATDVHNSGPGVDNSSSQPAETTERPQPAALPDRVRDRVPDRDTLYTEPDTEPETEPEPKRGTPATRQAEEEPDAWREAARLAHDELGLGQLSYAEEQRNASILRAWRYKEKRHGPEVVAAIRGAVAMRQDPADDSWLQAGQSYGLRALYNTKTVHRHREAGTVLLPLWTLLVRRGYRDETPDTPRDQRGGDPAPLSASNLLSSLGVR